MVKILGGLVLSTYFFLSWHRVPVYSNDVALWTDAVRLHPHTPRPWINLGSAVGPTADPEQAALARDMWLEGMKYTNNPNLPLRDRTMAVMVAAENLGNYYARPDAQPGGIIVTTVGELPPAIEARKQEMKNQDAAYFFDLALRARDEVWICQPPDHLVGC